MITEINITDNTRMGDCHYAQELETFENGVSYKFKPGINIIIGKNGCGKSTLLKLIYEYCLCTESMVSKVPDYLLALNSLFDDSGEIKGGIKIHGDYLGGVFRYLPKDELSKLCNDSIVGSIENLSIYASKCSTGESILQGLGVLFNKMFSGEVYEFPIKELEQKLRGTNEFWSSKLRNLLRYYRENRVDISSEEYEFTVLMDEPDRNLDINNIKEIYGILSYHKPQTQIIAVIHNPLLIYKLSKIVNIIEMTPGYLQEIINFVKDEKF